MKQIAITATAIAAVAATTFASAVPAKAQQVNASVEYLEIMADGTLTLYPWFAAKSGDAFTLLTIQGPKARFKVTAGAVKKQAGHCYADNVHQVTVQGGGLKGRIKPVQRGAKGQPYWPLAILISPPAPKAKRISPADVTVGDLPAGHIKFNVTQAIDISGNGKPDLLVIKTCSGYNAKKKVSQKALDRENHRQCVTKGPVFRQLWLKRGGAWKQVWYQDLC